MSGSTEALRRKIAGAGDLQGVVRSMKALAASNISQYEQAVLALEEYYRTVELGLAACLYQTKTAAFLEEAKYSTRKAEVGAVIFGSDQGLVGRFNEVLVDFAVSKLRAIQGNVARIWTLGERTHELMANSGFVPAILLPVPSSVSGVTPAIGRILLAIETSREEGHVGEVHVFHNHPKSGALYEPVGKQLLPLDQGWESKIAAIPWPTKQLPEVIGSTTSTLQAFIRGYFFVVLFQACAESLASENASRLAAMQRAEKNIEAILGELGGTLRRIRQESIDEELFDVISGFEALTKRSSDTSRF
jgi:F-type H+-transporting ATPase subunit gamma